MSSQPLTKAPIDQTYAQLMAQRQALDETINGVNTPNNPYSIQNASLKDSNNYVAVGVMWGVLAVSAIYFAIRHGSN
jgi:hypothetical protein